MWNGVCRGYGYVSERSRNESAYLGWLMPCVSHATGCGAGRVYHRPESKIKALEANEAPALTPIRYLRHLQSYRGRAASVPPPT